MHENGRKPRRNNAKTHGEEAMLKTTRTAALAILKADPYITPERLEFIRAAMDGNPPRQAATPADALLKPREVAALLKCHPKTVMQLANKGALKRIYAPQGRHALGISAESVRAFLRGEADTQKEAGE